MKHNREIKMLEHQFDFGNGKLVVYVGADKNLMIAEVNGRGGYGRIFRADDLFRLANNMADEKEKERTFDIFKRMVERLEKKIDELEKNLKIQQDSINHLSGKRPWFGWRK